MIRDPDVPLHTALRGQAGFALTEAIAAAAILALVALGVLAGIDGASSSSGREKARSSASALAERDQERLHAMRTVDLPELRQTRTENVGGTEYTIKSEADWISDANGGTVSCTSLAGKADYLRLRTIVTSKTVGTATAPVRLESLVAPPVGSAGGNNGTLAVQIKDRDALGEPNVAVSIDGTTANHSDTKSTNALGCAVFALIPGDTYEIMLDKAGWVDEGGNQRVETTGNVTPGATTVTSLTYDQAAQVTTGFDTRFWNPSLATPAFETRASRAWNVSFSNTRLPSGPRIFADTAATPTPLATITGLKLFPFDDGYGVYGGKCKEESPHTAALEAWAEANAHQVTDPGLSYTRTGPVRMPALPVRIHRGFTSGKPAWLGSANVVARLIVPPTLDDDGQPVTPCADVIRSKVDETNWGLQSYPTGRSLSGSSSDNYAKGLTGFVTKVPGTTGGKVEFDPGLPFGRWQICADANLSESGTNRRRRNFLWLDNVAPDGVAAVDTKPLDLGWTAPQAPTGSLQRDRDCSDSTGWPTVPAP